VFVITLIDEKSTLGDDEDGETLRMPVLDGLIQASKDPRTQLCIAARCASPL